MDGAPVDLPPTPACDRPPVDPAVPFVFDRGRGVLLSNIREYRAAAAPDGRLGVVFHTNLDEDVQYFESRDGGQTFGVARSVPASRGDRFQLVMGNGHAYLTYREGPAGGLLLRRALLQPGPIAFSEPVSIVEDSEVIGEVILGPRGRLAVLTTGASAGGSLLAAISEDGGATIRSRILVDPAASLGRGLFDDGGRLLVFHSTPQAMGWTNDARTLVPNATAFSPAIPRGPPGTLAILGWVFPGTGGEVLVPSVTREIVGGPVALALDHFLPAQNAWGDRVLMEVGLKCWLLAPLAGGRLVLVARPHGADAAPYLTVSTDGGRSFGPRHPVPAAMYQNVFCPAMISDGRALYFFTNGDDGTVGFLRGAQPGTSCP